MIIKLSSNNGLLLLSHFEECTIKYNNKKSQEKIMQIIKKYSIIAILTLSIVAGAYNNILSYADFKQSLP